MFGILIRQYLSRSHSLPSDSHRAFFGIETFLRTSYRIPFLWGLPEPDFDRALLWKPKSPSQTVPLRAGLQNWSWIGWAGDVAYGAQKCIIGGGAVNADEPGPTRACGTTYWKVPTGNSTAPVRVGTTPPPDRDGVLPHHACEP